VELGICNNYIYIFSAVSGELSRSANFINRVNFVTEMGFLRQVAEQFAAQRCPAFKMRPGAANFISRGHVN
jgi:hypothetical protein